MRRCLPAIIAACRLAGMLLCLWSATVNAQHDPLVGLWRTIDDRDGAPRALVRIVERGGEYVGTIEKGLRPEDEQRPTCDKCTGPRRGQPLLGMEILSGIKKDGGRYGGGEILDPDSGQIYRCTITLRDGGERLELRGYVGTPLLGRSQIWERAEPPS